MAKRYRVEVWSERGTKQDYDVEYSTLGTATAVFHRQVKPLIHERDAAVMLSLVTGPYSGIILASKATDQFHVEFTQSFYRT